MMPSTFFSLLEDREREKFSAHQPLFHLCYAVLIDINNLKREAFLTENDVNFFDELS